MATKIAMTRTWLNYKFKQYTTGIFTLLSKINDSWVVIKSILELGIQVLLQTLDIMSSYR